MRKFLLPRILGAVVTLWIAVTVVFLLGSVIGDPVLLILGDGATPEQVEALRADLGFDRPLYQQYFSYLGDLVRGDLGSSLRYRRSNAGLVLDRLPFTLQLAGAAVLLGVVIGVPIGVLAAWKENSIWDRMSVSLAVLFQSMPLFWLGLMAIILFSVRLGWTPAAGAGTWRHLILPAFTLAAYPISRIARIMRSSMSEVLEEEYISAARARGISERSLLLVHGLRNAALPVVTLIGLQAGALLSGAVTVEFVFAWPGLGTLALTAVTSRDITLVQAVVVVGVSAFVLINLAVDALYGVIDPRIRDAS